MKTYTFNSQYTIGETLPEFTQEQVKDEIMFFTSNYAFVKQHGGPLSQAFLSKLPLDWISNPTLVIDSRVHMLMTGWFPAIPGFHHDSVIRNRADGQPNYDVDNRAEHILALVNGDICPTEFAVGRAEFEEVPIGEKVYEKWHKVVIDKISSGELKSEFVPSNRMIYFDWQSWHQGTAAIKSGWRWFMRASINDGRKAKNEIRRQVQVYLENPMQGW